MTYMKLRNSIKRRKVDGEVKILWNILLDLFEEDGVVAEEALKDIEQRYSKHDRKESKVAPSID